MNADILPPAEAEVILIEGDELEINFTIDYYGSGNGYTKHQKTLLAIHDRNGILIEGVWTKDWSEAAPGIETCVKNLETRSGGQQHITEKCMRVSRAACPVYVKYRQSYEWVDYESSGDSNSYENWMWIKSIE